MSRMLIVSNVVLALVVCVLVWMLHAERAASAPHLRSAAMPHADMQERSSPNTADLHQLSARLDRIDRRLDALARASMSTIEAGPGPAASPSAVETTALSAAEADRRLAGMLPGPVVGHEAMARYRAQLAMLPPAHQAAIEAALSRAINQDRLRLRL